MTNGTLPVLRFSQIQAAGVGITSLDSFVGVQNGISDIRFSAPQVSAFVLNNPTITGAAMIGPGPIVPGSTARLNVATVPGTSDQGISVLQVGNAASFPGDFNYNQFIVSDAVNLATLSGTSAALYVEMDTGGPNVNSERAAIRCVLQHNSPGTNTTQDMIGVLAEVFGSQSSGGTAPDLINAKGTLYAFNPTAFAISGATNLLVVAGAEYDVGIFNGASAANRWGMSIPANGDLQGAVTDAALAISSTSPTASWKTGMLFGFMNGRAPFSANGSVMATDNAPVTVTNFADFSAWTFTSNIFNFANFKVTGSGAISTKEVASAAPQFDISGSAALGSPDPLVSRIAIQAAATGDYYLFIVSEIAVVGGTAVYTGSNAGAVLIGGDADWVPATTNPAINRLSVQIDGTGYAIYNHVDINCRFKVMAIRIN